MNAGWGLWPRISWNLPDFTWNPHEIHQISWNPLDFKIMSFCVMIKYRSFVFQKTNQKSFCWNIWFYKVWGGFHLKSAGFHEIRRISYGFHEIRRISCEIERPLQGIVTLCFIRFWRQYVSLFASTADIIVRIVDFWWKKFPLKIMEHELVLLLLLQKKFLYQHWQINILKLIFFNLTLFLHFYYLLLWCYAK